MEESMIPSLSAGAVGSRFVSQNEIETAKARREEQWKAAYARLGQEPPPQQQEDSYDGRSLAEKLAANRIAKQEEWEEKTKLANQFRALEEDEIMFLDSIRERQEEEERQRKERDGEELKGFKEAVAARTITSNPPPVSISQPSSASAAKPITTSAKKDPKRVLKGVIVKRKAKPVPKTSAAPGKDEKEKSAKVPAEATDSDDQPPDAKRRKTSIS